MLRRTVTAVAVAAALAMPVVAHAQALRQAIFDGDLAAVTAALARKPPINAAEASGGWTSLMNAVAYAKGHRVEIVRLLLDAGALLEAVNDRGETALIVAARYPRDNAAVVRLLLEHGAQVNARAGDGRTALMNSAFNLELDEILALVAHGADVNMVDAKGDSALLLALGEAGVPPDASATFPIAREKQILNAIEPLLQHGADPNAKNKAGQTAMAHVQRWESMTHGRPDIGVRLKQAGAKYD